MEARTAGVPIGTCLLRPHPASAASPATGIEVEARRTDDGRLSLRYRLSGDIAGLKLPPPTAIPGRTDELWRHTCFEAFVGPTGSDPYVEINLSPSGEWAAYSFDGYRNGMDEAVIADLMIDVRVAAHHLEVEVIIDLAGLVGQGPWRLALSAVIEDVHGGISWWALAHAPGKPDFHHACAFAQTLTPAEPS